NVVFMNNTAGLDAGAFTADGGPGNGGAIHVTGPGNNTITDGSASGNLAAAEGGAFWNGSGTMLVTGTSFDSNIASGADATNGGGALFNIGGTLTVSGASITNNVVDGTSGSGGGILNVNGGILSVTDTDILGNSASRAGGGIEDNSTVDLGDGALVGSVTLFGVQLNNNIAGSAPGNGGGLHLTGGADSNITSSVINGNTASNEGGGVWNGSGVMTISLTTIDGNTANGAAATNGGGGIFNNASGTINLNTSTVSNNVSTGAAAQGGGIHNKATTTLNVTASTISGNTSASNGGGIYNNGTASILNATIANNTATANGGGVSGESSVTVKGSIIATNTAATGTDVDGTFVSNDYNLIGDDSGNAFPESANDIENVNPAIGPLADNGGTTLTHMLLSTSAAANAGDPGDTSLDQIGNAVFGDARDIGALEDQDALGVEDFGNSLSDTVLFPNPSTNGNVSLNIPTNITNTVTIRVIDMTGKQVHSQQATSGSVTLNLNRLAVGTYLVNISDGNTSSTLKLLMSR
ncbi:T9SS type A sorting domain-containing protein, partial [Croceibacter atlanticus]